MTDPAGRAFGIDIGGTGIKGGVVDLGTGELSTDRERIPTPQPSTPEAVAAIVAQIVTDHQWTGPAGATFPGDHQERRRPLGGQRRPELESG